MYREFGLAGHEGLDFACPEGTEVRAAHDGYAYWSVGPTYGTQVWILGNECITVYAHLSQVSLDNAQPVQAGEEIGLSGNTGHTTGPHLHFGLKLTGVSNPNYNDWVDPEPLLEEEPMGSKTTLHIQRIESWMRQALRDWGVFWVKLVNPPESGEDPFPGVLKLVRMWTDNIDESYISRGEEGGRDFVRHMLPQWRARPWAACYSLANEPGCNSNEEIVNLRAYSIGAMREASAHGIRVCILEWAEGNPHDNETGDEGVTKWKVQQFAPAVREAINLGHYVGLHAYWRPGVAGPLDEWHSLGRVEKDVRWWQEAGVDVSRLRLLVTECGIDGGIGGHKETEKKGWRHFYPNISTYATEIAQFERRAQELPWLRAAMLFTAGYKGPWDTFDLDEGAVRSIIAKIETGQLPTNDEPQPDSISDQELALVREYFVSETPASVKDALRHGEEFVDELRDTWVRYRMPEFSGAKLYISYVRSLDRFKAVKLETRTWQRVGERWLP